MFTKRVHAKNRYKHNEIEDNKDSFDQDLDYNDIDYNYDIVPKSKKIKSKPQTTKDGKVKLKKPYQTTLSTKLKKPVGPPKLKKESNLKKPSNPKLANHNVDIDLSNHDSKAEKDDIDLLKDSSNADAKEDIYIGKKIIKYDDSKILESIPTDQKPENSIPVQMKNAVISQSSDPISSNQKVEEIKSTSNQNNFLPIIIACSIAAFVLTVVATILILRAMKKQKADNSRYKDLRSRNYVYNSRII